MSVAVIVGEVVLLGPCVLVSRGVPPPALGLLHIRSCVRLERLKFVFINIILVLLREVLRVVVVPGFLLLLLLLGFFVFGIVVVSGIVVRIVVVFGIAARFAPAARATAVVAVLLLCLLLLRRLCGTAAVRRSDRCMPTSPHTHALPWHSSAQAQPTTQPTGPVLSRCMQMAPHLPRPPLGRPPPCACRVRPHVSGGADS